MLSQFSSSSLLLCFHGMRHNLGTFLTSTNDDTNMILTGSQDQEAFSTKLEKSEWKHSYFGLKIIIAFFVGICHLDPKIGFFLTICKVRNRSGKRPKLTRKALICLE